jgi:hypothetical protein
MSELRTTPEPLPPDHFGVIATRALTFPAGSYRLRAASDDGIRVWLDDELVIDDWTHHAPRQHTHDFEVPAPREINMRVEYFELDGHAALEVAIGSQE